MTPFAFLLDQWFYKVHKARYSADVNNLTQNDQVGITLLFYI